MNSIRINEYRAKELDSMLRMCDNKESYYQYNELDEEKYEDLCVTANILERKGYIKIMSKQGSYLLVFLKDDGKTFIRNDSFLSQIEDKAKEVELESRKIELTERQIRALKAQPYLIAWGIITTLTSIILTIIQLTQ